MGDFSNRQKAKEEAKQSEKLSRETLGKYFYDLAKVTFTAMVVGGAVAWISDSDQILRGYFFCLVSFLPSH